MQETYLKLPMSSFRFINPLDGKERRAVYTYVKTQEGSQTVYTVGFAICHPTDNFNRQLGRAIAQNRLADGRNTLLVQSENQHSMHPFRKVVRDQKTSQVFILDSGERLTTAVRAAVVNRLLAVKEARDQQRNPTH